MFCKQILIVKITFEIDQDTKIEKQMAIVTKLKEKIKVFLAT